MFKTALKGVVAHKLRLALTALAIVLGVAFVSGTFVFTDTINARFETLFDDVYAGVDATVRAEQPEFGAGPGAAGGSIPESVLLDIQSTDGVELAVGSVGGFAQIINAEGEPVGGQGPPTLGFTWVDESALSPISIADGNGVAPVRAGEVVIDLGTAKTQGFLVGDIVEIQTMAGTESFEVVGLANFGTEDNLAGATFSIFSLAEGQRLFDLEGQLSAIDVIASDGVEANDLVATLTAVVPDGAEVLTGEQQTQEQIASVSEGLGFVTTALLAFAGVAVLVGAFVIQNTFRIVVAQRTRELALLRAVGATGRQVVSLVTIEAMIVAVVASAVGVATGIGVAAGLKNLMDAVGLNVPSGPLTVEPRTIVVGMAVGIVVTLVSAIVPARKAAAVSPVAAMSEAVAKPPRRSLRTRAIAGSVTAFAGATVLGTGLVLQNGSSLTLVSIGSVAVFIGVTVLAPLFAIPIARILGRPIPGVTGDLARENTIRQPRRTASTASALMIGIALVSFVSIFAASISASVTDTLEGAFPADLAFQSTNLTAGVSSEFSSQMNQLDEFAVVSGIQPGTVRVEGEERSIIGVDENADRVYSSGSAVASADIGSGVLVLDTLLEELGWAVGDSVAIEYAETGMVETSVVGTFDDSTFAGLIISSEAYAENFTNEDAALVFTRLAEGVDIEQGQAAAETVLSQFPSVDMNTKAEQIAQAEAQVDQLVALFSGLLGLAVVIAVLGIANTLALSIVERTREIGLLRAIGMSRRQVRRMIRWEAIIVALFGAILGIVVGSGLGWATVASLADQGLGSFALPFGQLGIWLLLAGLAGVAAAFFPARSASRMNILEAISYE